MGAPERSRSARRSRARRGRTFLLAVVVVVLTTVGASGGILWLTAQVLAHVSTRGGDERPVADVVELLKVALVVGLSRWAQSV